MGYKRWGFRKISWKSMWWNCRKILFRNGRKL